MQPKLSVIIASYNHQDYITETLRSLEEQTFQDFEIIIVDDGSSDKTVEVAKSAQSRAQIHTQENQGVVAARNRGVSMAKGKYICFVDSDDVRWIIDYKTGTPTADQTEASFIEAQSQLHTHQLLRYRKLFEAMEQRPIKTALFFTSLPKLVELNLGCTLTNTLIHGTGSIVVILLGKIPLIATAAGPIKE